MIEVLESDFNTIKPVWAHHLWDSRYKFESASEMLYLGGYDSDISKKFKPTFLKAVCNEQFAGVISGHKSSADHYRMRGLFVFSEFRGLGISQMLINRIIDQARLENCKMIWAAPRASSLPHLLKAGFVQTSDFTDKGFLYGPNCYVAKLIDL